MKALYNDSIHPKDPHISIPINHEIAKRLSTPPEGIDRAIWLYELCRFSCQKVNSIIIGLFSDEPACSAQTCSEMRASEWQYLCAVHDPPKPCCAIDYCCHTLDWAANVLTSQKHFPSRMTLDPEQGASHQQMRQLTNIFRRVYRIFAHAWFQHRDMFWKVEAKTGLYQFFKTVCDEYNLIPEDNYTIPPEAEGKEPKDQSSFEDIPTLETESKNQKEHVESKPIPPPHLTGIQQINTGHTTKRHRTTPSMDAGAISTVVEETEEDDKSTESVTTTIEEDGKLIFTEDEGLGISNRELGELVNDETKDLEANSSTDEITELEKSLAAVRVMDEAIKEVEASEKSLQPSQSIPIPVASKSVTNQEPEPENTSTISKTSPDLSLTTEPLVTKIPEIETPAKGSPRLKSDELKSKIPIAKKDVPNKKVDISTNNEEKKEDREVDS